MHWQCHTLTDDFVQRARQYGRDDLGQTVQCLVAAGGEPLRDSLRRARAGEAILLASYSPFLQAGPYKEYGPVFLAATADTRPLPALGRVLATGHDYLGEQMAVRAYDAAQTLLDAVIVPRSRLAGQLAAWGDRPEVTTLMLRFAAYGCYALQLKRTGRGDVPA